MEDLKKRLSTNKVDLHVGLKFKTGMDGIIYEITSISDEYLNVGWDGIKDRVDYLAYNVNEYFKNGTWIVYEHSDKFVNPQQPSSLEQDIQKLKDKYKQYKFTITIEDNI